MKIMPFSPPNTVKWCPGHRVFHPKTAFSLTYKHPEGRAVYCRAYFAYLRALWKG